MVVTLAPPATLDERVQLLCRTVLDALVFLNDSRRYVYVNDAAAELLGAPVEVILASHADNFTPQDRLAVVERTWTQFKRNGELQGRGPVMRHDGSVGMVQFRGRWGFAPGLHLIAMREIGLPARPASSDGDSVPRLTPRERQVLELAAEGHSTSAIAAALGVSAGTVKTHFQHMYQKLDAPDRVSAVATALRVGLIS